MIYCIINGKNHYRVQHTHANNKGFITTFFYLEKGTGSVSANSFNLSEYDSVEDFLRAEYKAELVEKLNF